MLQYSSLLQDTEPPLKSSFLVLAQVSLPYWSLNLCHDHPQLASRDVTRTNSSPCLLVTQQDRRVSGVASGLEIHRTLCHSRGKGWVLGRIALETLPPTNSLQFLCNSNSHFWEKEDWRNTKYQTKRLDEANSSSIAFVLTQQYLPNKHQHSDLAVCCCSFLCTFNSDSITFKMNCWDKSQVLSKTTPPSG